MTPSLPLDDVERLMGEINVRAKAAYGALTLSGTPDPWYPHREDIPWLLQQLAASRSEVERLRGALEQAAEGLECVAECMAINDGGKKEDYDAWLFARDARTALAPKETAPDEKRCSCDLVNCCGCPVHCYCGGKGSSLCRCALAPKETPR